MRISLGTATEIRVKPAILLVGTVALAACAGNQSEVGAPPRALAQAPSVEVGPREVIATFPRTVGSELSWPAAHRASSWDTDQWRLMIPLGSGWLVAVHQVDVDSSLMAIARSSTEAAVGAGHLLGCDLGTHVLACGEPLAGSVTVVNGEVVMRIAVLNGATRCECNGRGRHASCLCAAARRYCGRVSSILTTTIAATVSKPQMQPTSTKRSSSVLRGSTVARCGT
jgi:hypothetical protein